MNRKNVCHIITGLETGGAETQLLRVLRGTSNSHFDHSVISLRTEGEIGNDLKALGISVHTLGLTGWHQFPRALRKIHHILKTTSPDLIQGWMYHGNAVASATPLLYGRRVPVAWNVRHALHDLTKEQPSTRRLISWSHHLSSRAALIVYNSNVARDQHEKIGFQSERATVIPNGFDLSDFDFQLASRNNIRKMLQIPGTARVVGQVARYHPIKNHQGFLKMATAVLATVPDTHFLMIGKNVTPENAELHAYTAGIPASQLHMVGRQTDMRAYYSAMDVLCNPSWSEGFPNVIGEAMACGIPCVAADVGESSYLIGDAAQITAPDDTERMAAAVADILLRPSHSRLELSRAARMRIMNCFSIESVCEKYLAHYDAVTDTT